MKREDFEEQLRTMMSEPFHRFEVVFTDGRVLEVDRRVTIGGGAAGYLTDAGEFVRFASDEVKSIGWAQPTRQGGPMSADQFEDTLRLLVRKEPFEPFQVELADGNVLSIEMPVVFNSRYAGYMSPDGQLVEFHRDEVRAIRQSAGRVAS